MSFFSIKLYFLISVQQSQRIYIKKMETVVLDIRAKEKMNRVNYYKFIITNYFGSLDNLKRGKIGTRCFRKWVTVLVTLSSEEVQ